MSFTHRSCYVNFAEHLQNSWNPNLYFPGAPNRWTFDEWKAFFVMLKAFGFTCFRYWIPPTLVHQSAIEGAPVATQFAVDMRHINTLAHDAGLQVKTLMTVNTIGAEWYFACPNVPEDRALIRRLWQHWMEALPGIDIAGIFPGDPGGCNRNGCTHETFIDLALELSELIKSISPDARVEVGTWGTPFSGWGSDLRETPGWQGDWQGMISPKEPNPEVPCHIWNGDEARAQAAMAYLLRRLPEFPSDTIIAINLGFDPESFPTLGGDARSYAREIAKNHAITTWDYGLSEGELICYPHWRLPRIATRRREERAAAPYLGGMTYTMTPKLNLLSLYGAAQLFLNPDADPDTVSRTFCQQVFGDEQISDLLEAFEVVNGWGYYPRKRWSKPALRRAYSELIERLEAVDTNTCSLPIFPDPGTYRQDLLWFARQFFELAGTDPDRETVRRAYWQRAMAIYDVIPMSVDERAEESARQFSQILV